MEDTASDTRGFCQIAIAQFVFGPIQCGISTRLTVTDGDGNPGWICAEHFNQIFGNKAEGKRKKEVTDDGVS